MIELRARVTFVYSFFLFILLTGRLIRDHEYELNGNRLGFVEIHSFFFVFAEKFCMPGKLYEQEWQ